MVAILFKPQGVLEYLAWWHHQMETFSTLLAFVRGIHQSPVNSPHKGQWCGALMFSLICAWINSWENNHGAGDLRCHHTHDVTTMINWFLIELIDYSPSDMIDSILDIHNRQPYTCSSHSHLYQSMQISMGQCKKDVTPLLMHWSYIFLALTHRYDISQLFYILYTARISV